jgi:hypothetical protein
MISLFRAQHYTAKLHTQLLMNGFSSMLHYVMPFCDKTAAAMPLVLSLLCAISMVTSAASDNQTA